MLGFQDITFEPSKSYYVKTFRYPSAFAFHVIMREDGPWFWAEQITFLLDIPEPSHLICDSRYELNYATIPEIKTNRSIPLVNLQGFCAIYYHYSYGKKSHFKDWIFEEVLPNLPQANNYLTPMQLKHAAVHATIEYDTAFLTLLSEKYEREAKLEAENKELRNRLENTVHTAPNHNN